MIYFRPVMDGEVDEGVCPVCEGSTWVGETISCEICQRWFHFTCVGVTHQDHCVRSEDVPYYCPSCDVKVRKAKKAKKQAQAKELKARAASAVVVEPIAKQEDFMNVNSINILEIEANVNISNDHSSDDDLLVIDTNKFKHKSAKKKPEKKSGVVTEMIPQLEVSQLKPAIKKSEEEAWLDAVESGDLEQVESCDSELRTLREPSYRTARQRALASGNDETDEDGLLAMLHFGKKTAEKEMTEEERAIKAQKRRELETEKKEKMKQKTMDMLLKKKDSKATKQIKTAKSTLKEDEPKISYISNSDGISLSYPEGEHYPRLTGMSRISGPCLPVTCSMCHNVKKYNSSSTGSPVCSIVCYKADLQRSHQIELTNQVLI